ncbi:FadR/GntR family transcriptional regulator [Pelomonas sp. KK5]|uniref:FadR/GntR family transcriptional regulator n=1 Tax=Pelomonas sp. KK5 TaxID=1855730 RepID=UPI0009FB3250|nr:FCD domain-containing protein [Pelomonas sp. KK5]
MLAIAPLSPIERPTLSAQVARHLLALIQTEQLRPGDPVPSEVKIGLDLQVSRGSVREAYRSLAALGILEIEGGRKPRLRVVDASVMAQVFDYALNTAQVSIAHVLETRRAIELQTAQLAARYATDAQRQQLRELASQMRTAHNKANHARRVAADSAIHTLIAEASANPLNALLLGALRSPLEASAAMHLDESRSESELIRVIDAHEALVERICAGDAIGASSAMSYHFDLAMVHVQRTAPSTTAPPP